MKNYTFSNIINPVAEQLWIEYEPYVRRLCRYKLCAFPDRVEDCISDTFLALITALDSGAKINNPKAWLYSVAANKAADILRDISMQEKTIVPLNENCAQPVNTGFEIDVIDDEKICELKEKVFSLLTDDDLTLLKEKYTDKLNTQQLAAKYSTTENNIYQKLHRLKRKTVAIIRELLNNQ